MHPVLDVPLTLYKYTVSRNELQEEIKTLTVVLDPLFAERKDLPGNERFRLQKLGYDNVRQYVVLLSTDIKEGRIVADDGDLLTIVSIERVEKIWAVITCTVTKDLEMAS